MGALLWWEGDQFSFQGGAMCKATLDFVEQQQSTSLASLLQRRPAQHLQHAVDTRGVHKPAQDEVCRSPLDCFVLGNVFLRVWVPEGSPGPCLLWSRCYWCNHPNSLCCLLWHQGTWPMKYFPGCVHGERKKAGGASYSWWLTGFGTWQSGTPCPSSPPNQWATGGLPVAGLGRGHWKSSCTLLCHLQRVVLTPTISQAYRWYRPRKDMVLAPIPEALLTWCSRSGRKHRLLQLLGACCSESWQSRCL